MPDRRRAWARALFLAVDGREGRAAVADALEALALAVVGEPRLREFLSDPSVAKEARTSVLSSALPAQGAQGAQGAAAAVFARFCTLIVDKGRAFLLPEISRSYGEFRDADEGIARLEVEAAREVAAPALERIASAWTRYSGASSTRARVKVDPSLIAGYRLRAGSLRIDYSIAGRLERLRRELALPLGQRPGDRGAADGAGRGEG